MRTRQLAILIAVGFAAVALHAAAAAAGTVDADQAFDALKGLAGMWQGSIGAPDGPPATVEYKVTSAGSAVVETLFPGTEHEMVNVYHRDGDALLMTHYCAGGNQPRLRLDTTASDESTLRFEFMDGTNMDPAKGAHMHAVTHRLAASDRLESRWESWQDGKPEESGTGSFLLARQP